jgi:hypothetical protein
VVEVADVDDIGSCLFEYCAEGSIDAFMAIPISAMGHIDEAYPNLRAEWVISPLYRVLPLVSVFLASKNSNFVTLPYKFMTKCL